MSVFLNCRRVVTAVTVAALAAAIPLAANAATDTSLNDSVRAVHAAGSIGVLAESRSPDGTERARAGTARIGTGRPVPYPAEFRIGSTTKTFISVTLLQLAGEGRLSLDDPVQRWLPGLIRGHGNDGRLITVRELLQHTSGLFNYAEDPRINRTLTTAAGFRQNRFRSYTPEQLVAIALQHRPNFAPGTGWSYSDTNYVLAGMIIHRVTGHTWAEEVRRRILTPLGLGHTYVPGNLPFLIGPHAQGYNRFPDAPGLLDVTAFNPSAADASGSMVSTTADLNAFGQALFGGRLLKPAQLRQLRATVPVPADFGVPPGTRYGLGLFRFPLSCGGVYWGHPGDLPGFQTVNGVTPDGRSAVVVSSTGPETVAVQKADLGLADQALCAR